VKNINPYYKIAKIDLKNDLVAYIDESGDEGFKFAKNCTKWFVTSAIALSFPESNEMLKALNGFASKYCSNKKINSHKSFKDLSHGKRKNVLGMLKNHNYLTVHSCFNKEKIDPNDTLTTYPSMYFVGIKNLIERLSWITKQYGKDRVHILISNRNSIPSANLSKYLFKWSVRAARNMTYLDKLGCVSLSTINNHPKLLLSDYTASSMFQCLEKTGEANIPEKVFFEIFLKGKLFSSNHSIYKGVLKNGFKCTPEECSDILYLDDILEEGTHKL